LKIFNNTNLPLVILDLNSITGKTFHRIESNEEFSIPIDLLYENSNSSIILAVDEYILIQYILIIEEIRF
jgi:hypothetical protein